VDAIGKIMGLPIIASTDMEKDTSRDGWLYEKQQMKIWLFQMKHYASGYISGCENRINLCRITHVGSFLKIGINMTLM
jgi:hypothetical protein